MKRERTIVVSDPNGSIARLLNQKPDPEAMLTVVVHGSKRAVRHLEMDLQRIACSGGTGDAA